MSLTGMSIIEQDELIKTLSNEQLQNYAQNPDGRLPLYLVIAQLKRNEDTKQRFAALQAEQENAQQPRTVAARLAPRPGEMPVPASQAGASPAPPTPPQAGGAPQMPTVNAQHGMTYEKLMKATARLAEVEEDEKEDLTKPDFFGREKGSFERGGETSTAEYPANVMAALRKGMAEEDRSRVHEGFETRGPDLPKPKKGRFTAAAKHARTSTGYAYDPLKLAMESGLAGLKRRKRRRSDDNKRPTVNAQDGYNRDEIDDLMPGLQRALTQQQNKVRAYEKGAESGASGAAENLAREREALVPLLNRMASLEVAHGGAPADYSGSLEGEIVRRAEFDPEFYGQGEDFTAFMGGMRDDDTRVATPLTDEAIRDFMKEAGPPSEPDRRPAWQAAMDKIAVNGAAAGLNLETPEGTRAFLQRKEAAGEDTLSTNGAGAAAEPVSPRRTMGDAFQQHRAAQAARAEAERVTEEDRLLLEGWSGEAEDARLTRKKDAARPPEIPFSTSNVAGLRNVETKLPAAAAAESQVPVGSQLAAVAAGRDEFELTAAERVAIGLDPGGAAGVELTDVDYEKALTTRTVAGAGALADTEAEKIKLAEEKAADDARILAEGGVEANRRWAELTNITVDNASRDPDATPDKIAQLRANISAGKKKIIDIETILKGKSLTVDQMKEAYQSFVNPSRKQYYKSLNDAMEAQTKVSKTNIAAVQEGVDAINEYSRTGKLPEGRRNALFNKLLLTWSSALLGHPTLAEAMSQGFANSINVIDGEQENYSKALTENLQAVKAINELKMKSADSRAAAYRNIASGRKADIQGDTTALNTFIDRAAKDTQSQLTHERQMLIASSQLLNSEVALLKLQQPTVANNQKMVLTQGINTKFASYRAAVGDAIKKAKKDKTNERAAIDRVNANYIEFFGKAFDKEGKPLGILDPKAWKPTGFKEAARVLQRPVTGAVTTATTLSVRNTATEAHGKLTEKSRPEVMEDDISMAVLQYLIPGIKSDGSNLLELYGKNKKLVTDNFVKLYRAQLTAEITGQPSPLIKKKKRPNYNIRKK